MARMNREALPAELDRLVANYDKQQERIRLIRDVCENMLNDVHEGRSAAKQVRLALSRVEKKKEVPDAS